MRSCGAFNSHIDFAAQRTEVDWLVSSASAPLSKALCFASAVNGGRHFSGAERRIFVKRFRISLRPGIAWNWSGVGKPAPR